MNVERRITRLETRHGAAVLLVVVAGDDGGWTDAWGAPVAPADVPPGATVVVIGLRADGPQ